MAKKASVDYDEENDILYFHTGEKIKDSLDFDQFVFDFSHDERIVGLEIMNASKLLKKLGVSVSKSALAKVRDAVFSTIQQREFLYVKVLFAIRLRGKTVQKEILAPAPIPQAIRAR